MITVLTMLNAYAQDLPPTVCDDATMLCAIHKDRLATLVGKASSIPDLTAELNQAADKIDTLANELEAANATIEDRDAALLSIQTQLTAEQEKSTRSNRQRNAAYWILAGSATALAGGIYVASTL